jgi:pyruvate/2-oxoglutarate dehydrogenase complex dihydrolipoamide dehydrogenase (E3) component
MVGIQFIDSNGNETEILAEKLLVGTGRKPVFPENLEGARVHRDKKGLILDKHLKTTASNIYACGDAAGPYRFSHVAEYQGVIAALNSILPVNRSVNYENIIWVTYTDPEFAHAGMTEDQAREKYGDEIKIFRYGYDHLDRAKTDFADGGLGKFIIDKKGKLIGAHILGRVAGEIIHEAQIIKSFDLDFSKIQSVMHSYPTFSDITRQVGKKVYIEELQNNLFIKFIKKIKGKK